MLEDLAAGATDYFAGLVGFGDGGDVSRGTGIGYSFATDRPEGFGEDDLVLLKAILPVVSLGRCCWDREAIGALCWSPLARVLELGCAARRRAWAEPW